MTAVILWILAVACVVVGILGTVVPALPGAPLVFGGLVLVAWADNFTKVSWGGLISAGVFTALTLVVDFVATALGAKKVGASYLAVIGAALGTLFGLFFALPGVIFGPFVGAFVGEYYANRDMTRAGKVGVATWLGLLIGTILKLVLIFWMIGVFAVFYLF